MPARILRRWGPAALLTVLTVLGCGQGVQGIFLPNQPPEVHITRTTRETATDGSAAYRIFWQGEDPDGRVDHYLIAVDPLSLDSLVGTWTVVRGTDYQVSAGPSVSRQPHVFAVRAVDGRGGVSRAAWFAYSSDNIPPTVQIVSPQPSRNVAVVVGSDVTIHWVGSDPDGPGGKPVRYKFRLFSRRNPDVPNIPDFVAFALQNPDSLRRLYAPGFAGWDSLPGDSTSIRYTGLTLNEYYLFVITAIDQAGDYDPVFSAGKNMLSMAVGNLCALGPRLCFGSPALSYCYPTGKCEDDPSLYARVEIPAGQRITISWFATPVEGTAVTGYRWVLDPADLTDETPRAGDWDVNHWSEWSLTNTQATTPPFQGAGEHRLYVEAMDTSGALSLGAVSMTVVQARFERDLLVVDDTRLVPDGVTNGVLDPPRGPWPTAAELDTFLFARGGFPWQGYPAGTTSATGLFEGYGFDTIGTRGRAGLPLALLSRYRTVVWLVNDVGAAYTGDPSSLTPMTLLRQMTSPGGVNELASYMQAGGRLWLMGGGAAYATLAAYDRRNTPPDQFDNFPDNELVAGRFMYDFAHWRTALALRPAKYALLNVPEMNPAYPNAAPGRGWVSQGIQHDLSMPDYQKLRDPANGAPALMPRTCASDPPSPLRDCSSMYLVGNYSAEFLGLLASVGAPNAILEDADPSPDVVNLESTLDTLYFVSGGTAPYGRPVMTYYHGFESPQMVFSGFPLWYFQRTQAARLTQFVLTDIFGLPRAPSAPAAKPGASAGMTARPLRRRPMTTP